MLCTLVVNSRGSRPVPVAITKYSYGISSPLARITLSRRIVVATPCTTDVECGGVSWYAFVNGTNALCSNPGTALIRGNAKMCCTSRQLSGTRRRYSKGGLTCMWEFFSIMITWCVLCTRGARSSMMYVAVGRLLARRAGTGLVCERTTVASAYDNDIFQDGHL